jgi:Xaa-Pro aminopeptidase
MKYAPIDPSLFIRNRQRLSNRIQRGSVAVFNSNDIMPTSADGIRSFVQNTDLFYLTGIDQEESILVICPDAQNQKHREILFLRETNEKIATWEGPKHTKEEASKLSGIETVLWTSEFESIFRALVCESEHIYLNTNEHLRADVSVQTRDDRFIKWCRSAYPLHKYERLAPVMRHLRAVKSSIEVELIRQACEITEKAFRRLLGFIRPGVWEFEIEAEICHEFLRNRSRGPAYEPIVASGPNACILHYVKNDRQCQSGELVLMDFGAEYANYASDLSRTLPVNGRFTPRQRAVYDAVLRVQRGAVDMLRPGNTLKEYHKAVGNLMEKELLDLGLLDPEEVKKQDPEKPLYKKYYMHGASHHMGLDVHDVADLHRKFAPGMVFTCEPGLYIKDEGIGVRIENDILVTKGAPTDLMATIPVEAEEIEGLMN